MKVLITGSRHWTNQLAILREMRKLPPKSIIVHGAAPGADSIAGGIARELGFIERRYPAEWKKDPIGAGLERNRQMLIKEHRDEEPIDLCLAFTRDLHATRGGTRDMTRLCEAVGIEVRRFDR